MLVAVVGVASRGDNSELIAHRLPPPPAPTYQEYLSSPVEELDLRLRFSAVYFDVAVPQYGPPGYVRRPYDLGPAFPVYLAHRSPHRLSHVTIAHDGHKRKTHLQWGGRVHLDGILDFDPIGSTAQFVTSTIPVPQERGGNTNFSARQSRLQLKTQTNSSVGPITGFMQLDFFNDDTQGPSGSYRPQLRFLYADVGHLRFGQDATVFMDYGAYPNVIENEGPAAIILVRQSLVRGTLPIGDYWNVAVAAEQPFSDITLPEDAMGDPIGERLQELPDFTGHVNFDNGYGHLQTAGIVRRITYEAPDESTLNTTGYGINFTGDMHLWAYLFCDSPPTSRSPSPLAKSRFVWQYAAGYGIARYIEDANGLRLDAALDSGGNLDALFARAWYVGYEHWWNKEWTSTFVYSDDANSTTDTQSGDTYAGAIYIAANLIWNYADSAWVGLEYLWGERRDTNGQSAEAHRIQLGMRYEF